MTGHRKLAHLSAVALAALAASAMDPIPQARAVSDESSEASRGTCQEGGPADAGSVEVQRQVNDLGSELLDERALRIERWQEANAVVLVLLGIAIGIGGLWTYARFRSIADEASIVAVATVAPYPCRGACSPGPRHVATGPMDTGLTGWKGNTLTESTGCSGK